MSDHVAPATCHQGIWGEHPPVSAEQERTTRALVAWLAGMADVRREHPEFNDKLVHDHLAAELPDVARVLGYLA